MINWERKLAAFLHDPPEKAYDYGPRHLERGRHHASNAGVENTWQGSTGQPDWAAAAADRFIFPSGNKIGRSLGDGVEFVHPLSGRGPNGNPSLNSNDFPSQDDAEKILDDVLPAFQNPNVAIRFYHAWRLWLHHAVTHHAGQRRKAETLAYLPADTRIPDASIWHHLSVVSALETTRGTDGHLHPAFLLFQIGPVQDFIAQARSTRDLWSGSYLLSWMMAHAMKCLADKFGPDCIIFPSLRGQPLFDWLERGKLEAAQFPSPEGQRTKSFWDEFELNKNQDLVLTPNLPNRFLAVVPSDFNPAEIEEVFSADGWNDKEPRSEWARIVGASWGWLDQYAPIDANRERWNVQVRNFWQVTWQLWPWQETAGALELLKTAPLGQESPLHLASAVADSIPPQHRDDRCYKNGKLDPGWAWNAHYQLLAHRHDARRHTRDFAAWRSEGHGHKDYFSGKEEVIATKAWREKARKKNAEFAHLFRHDDELGAINLIKRVWHKAYLQQSHRFGSTEFKFASVLSIAASSWRNKVLNSVSVGGEAWTSLLAFQRAVAAAEEVLDFELPADRGEENWLKRVDVSVLYESYWNSLKLEQQDEKKLPQETALAALGKLLEETKAGEPGKYYAVLALDGDEIGKWLSGARTPTVESVITAKAAEYFRQNVEKVELGKKQTEIDQWLKSRRPLSPSYHLQFSEALANFGLYAVYRIVGSHNGQLIYSGGDDVLAMVPAEQSIACAKGLRMAFQGSPELTTTYNTIFDSCPAGFIKLKEGDRDRGGRRPSEPSWPLLVPGPRATVSVGIAIGHVKEPLQDMIKAAQAAEKAAKTKYDRNALAVTLFKRSGELIEWGTSFTAPEEKESAALRLLTFVQSKNRFRNKIDDTTYQPPISGKFPYRLAELLQRYQEFETPDGFPDFSQPKPITPVLRKIAEQETAWAISRQCERLKASEAEEFSTLCNAYLTELETRKRPLCEFYHLFAIEAFIARQGE